MIGVSHECEELYCAFCDHSRCIGEKIAAKLFDAEIFGRLRRRAVVGRFEGVVTSSFRNIPAGFVAGAGDFSPRSCVHLQGKSSNR